MNIRYLWLLVIVSDNLTSEVNIATMTDRGEVHGTAVQSCICFV